MTGFYDCDVKLRFREGLSERKRRRALRAIRELDGVKDVWDEPLTGVERQKRIRERRERQKA